MHTASVAIYCTSLSDLMVGCAMDVVGRGAPIGTIGVLERKGLPCADHDTAGVFGSDCEHA